MERKPELRRRILACRDALSPEERTARSALAAERLFAQPEVARAETVMFFVSFGSEIETLPMLDRALAGGLRVAVPRVDRGAHAIVPHEVREPATDLAPGHYGIPEPARTRPVVGLDAIDVVIVPGVAWGEDGYRVGYGGGYYDRFLLQAPQARRIGLAFELQVLPAVVHGEHDLPVEVLVTEAKVRRFAGRG